jgi:hypothetical protein
MANYKLRQFVTERAFGCCEYCMSKEKFSSQSFSLEHIFPKILGGNQDIDNLALACQGCNNFKFTKIKIIDKDTETETSLFNPRQDEWTEHFGWNHNCTIILGLSAIGRVTVDALQLNRENLINQRIIYRAFGIHPPKHSI